MKKPSAATQKPAGTPPAAPSPRRLCVFKVALREDRRTWRRIAIRQNQTLEDLHDAIFAAFDRHDPHLFSFYLLLPADDKRRRGQRRPPEGTPEYVHPFTLEDLPFWMEDAPVHDATATRLADLRLQPGQRAGIPLRLRRRMVARTHRRSRGRADGKRQALPAGGGTAWRLTAAIFRTRRANRRAELRLGARGHRRPDCRAARAWSFAGRSGQAPAEVQTAPRSPPAAPARRMTPRNGSKAARCPPYASPAD